MSIAPLFYLQQLFPYNRCNSSYLYNKDDHCLQQAPKPQKMKARQLVFASPETHYIHPTFMYNNHFSRGFYIISTMHKNTMAVVGIVIAVFIGHPLSLFLSTLLKSIYPTFGLTAFYGFIWGQLPLNLGLKSPNHIPEKSSILESVRKCRKFDFKSEIIGF